MEYSNVTVNIVYNYLTCDSPRTASPKSRRLMEYSRVTVYTVYNYLTCDSPRTASPKSH